MWFSHVTWFCGIIACQSAILFILPFFFLHSESFLWLWAPGCRSNGGSGTELDHSWTTASVCSHHAGRTKVSYLNLPHKCWMGCSFLTLFCTSFVFQHFYIWNSTSLLSPPFFFLHFQSLWKCKKLSFSGVNMKQNHDIHGMEYAVNPSKIWGKNKITIMQSLVASALDKLGSPTDLLFDAPSQ